MGVATITVVAVGIGKGVGEGERLGVGVGFGVGLGGTGVRVAIASGVGIAVGEIGVVMTAAVVLTVGTGVVKGVRSGSWVSITCDSLVEVLLQASNSRPNTAESEKRKMDRIIFNLFLFSSQITLTLSESDRTIT